jgi:hypothetical protein
VKYTENILYQVWNKYIYTIFIKFSLKSNSSNKIHNNFIFIKDNVPNKIGGARHRNSVEKIEMKSVSPYIESAPLNCLDFKTCEFVEHLEMSEALIKYNTSIYMMCNIALHLLVDCLFHASRVSIGHQHSMPILNKMTKSEITKLFNIHSKTCEHKYITVLQPCDKIVQNYPPTVQSTFCDFPPASPNPSLCKKNN